MTVPVTKAEWVKAAESFKHNKELVDQAQQVLGEAVKKLDISRATMADFSAKCKLTLRSYELDYMADLILEVSSKEIETVSLSDGLPDAGH